jgi:hypothetical protein
MHRRELAKGRVSARTRFRGVSENAEAVVYPKPGPAHARGTSRHVPQDFDPHIVVIFLKHMKDNG